MSASCTKCGAELPGSPIQCPICGGQAVPLGDPPRIRGDAETASPGVELAEAYLAQRRFTEAMVVAKKALRAAADSVGPRLVLARTYLAQGKPHRARRELQDLLEAQPECEEAIRLLQDLESND